jgi:hypothetical protein
MTIRRWMSGVGLAAFIAASYVAHLKFNRELTSRAVGPGGSLEAPDNLVPSNGVAGGDSGEPAIRINAARRLASVNGKELKLADLTPLNPAATNQDAQFSPATYRYLLDRAVNRELILQTAKAQGVELDESRREQLDQFRMLRKQSEPGLVQALNVDQGRVDFETRDAEAFMLQTELLVRTGASPNVSAEEVQEYYRQHGSEFPGLPADEPARSETWAEIDFQIRTQLSPIKRATFQNQLAAFMNQIKSSANIVLAPLP